MLTHAKHAFAAGRTQRADARHACQGVCWREANVRVRVAVLGVLSTITMKPSVKPGGPFKEEPS